MELLRCSDLSFAYGGETVLKGVSFAVNAGDYLCVVGENGSGKSTLMKGLLGLKEPDSGSIEYAGGLKRNEIGYLPQQTALQKDFPASVFEVVLSGRLNSMGRRFFYSKEDKKEAERNLDRMGMLEYKKRCYQELSGGQQQRVLLARALCATSRLLLLDLSLIHIWAPGATPSSRCSTASSPSPPRRSPPAGTRISSAIRCV